MYLPTLSSEILIHGAIAAAVSNVPALFMACTGFSN